ncbi:MAG: beta-glucosidase [Alphaproteobacteria bacterium]|nr:MAG: beta-glucosidase [Alphaproteobacteria bacterium]
MPMRFTRRQLGTVGASALGAAAASAPSGPRPGDGADDEREVSRAFPAGFLWGTATAAYQIEGAVSEDGRGPSIWDTFTHTPGRIRNNDNGDVADDHYHRYRDDVRSMNALAVAAYRFSISWPRVFPQGTGAPNPKGLDFYNRLLDNLLASGIAPFPTLYHWDLPQALQDRGGWETRDTAKAFADYAGYVAEKLSDRARYFFTLNECATFVELGYRTGVLAPGLKLPPGRLNQVRHHALLAHGLAVQAIRARSRAGTQIGLAENISVCVPVIEAPEHIAAAELATRELNAPYVTAIMEGRYRESFLAAAGTDAPKVAAEDMHAISTPVDFVGINIYGAGSYVRASDAAPGFVSVPFPAKYPTMNSSWLKIAPEALYWGPRNVAKVWNASDIYITENGCSATDVPADDGIVYDTDRIMFLRNYLTQLQRATSEGVPVRGYFHWSLMDNFEWAEGFGTRFGLLYVDYATQQRTAKLSASFYREVAARNRLV